VYRFVDSTGRTLYSGRATDLSVRVARYFARQPDRPRLARMMPRVAEVQALQCASVPEAAWLERNLHARAKPPFNRMRGGLETELWLELDIGTHPGLRLRYEARDDCFGPYLGGTQLRLGINGLNRVAPLWLTGARLSPAERELAARRGVLPSDRPALIQRLRLILARDQDAVAGVLDELTAARDRASGGELFEVAGQLHEELGGVAWITAPQRVTTQGPTRTVTARASGLELRLGIHRGRLDEWRLCTTDGADLAPDPGDPLEPFVLENLGLALALRAAVGDDPGR
jgi:excinuclease ABC subunit C